MIERMGGRSLIARAVAAAVNRNQRRHLLEGGAHSVPGAVVDGRAMQCDERPSVA